MTRKENQTANWQAIRAAVERGDASLESIARQFGASRSTIYRRRQRWMGIKADTGNKKAKAGKAGKDGKDGIDHKAMVDRLYAAADQQIRNLESRLASGEAAFDEREARMLGTIARTLDKIMDLTPKEDATAKTARKAQDMADDHDERDPDILRKELAQRLERLQQRSANGLSGEPDGTGAGTTGK